MSFHDQLNSNHIYFLVYICNSVFHLCIVQSVIKVFVTDDVSRDDTVKNKKKSGRRRNVYKIIRKKRIAKCDKIRNEEKLNDIDIQWSIIIRSDEICFCFFAPINRNVWIDGFKSFAENCRNNARCVPSSDCVWTKWKWTNGRRVSRISRNLSLLCDSYD